MRYINCLCGYRVEGEDVDDLTAAFFSHTDEAHADIQVSDARRRELERTIRRTGGWDGGTLTLGSDVEVRPLTPALRDDYLRFFDLEAFTDNPVWGACYCLSYHLGLTGVDFDERTAAENRPIRAAQIDRGEATGVLAFAGDRVAGWCNAGPYENYPTLATVPEFVAEEPETTGSIVCFVIAPPYRGQGLAPRLLGGACDMLRERGLRRVEAYPPKSAAGDARSYHGRLDMYLRAGFEPVRENERYVVVRKALD